MWKDPIVEEIRAESERYAKQFDFDLHAIFQDLKKRERVSGRRLVSLPPKRFMNPQQGAAYPVKTALQHA